MPLKKLPRARNTLVSRRGRKRRKLMLAIGLTTALVAVVVAAGVITVVKMNQSQDDSAPASVYEPVRFNSAGEIVHYEYAFFGGDDDEPQTFSTVLESTVEIDGVAHEVASTVEAKMTIQAALALFNERVAAGDPLEYEGDTSIGYVVLDDALSQLTSAIEAGAVREIAYQAFGTPRITETDQEVVASYLLEQEQERIKEEQKRLEREALINECLELGIDPCLGPAPTDMPEGNALPATEMYFYEHTCVSYAVAAINTRDFLEDVDRLFADVKGIRFDVETSIELNIETELPCTGRWESTQPDPGGDPGTPVTD